ncbi:MAG: 2Fe-2S iron-sulfur cluster-binding protein, partial [Bacteroides sp.]|nr:2Fe-2S iron-sulfur cluster-binding protein [Bacteroides sp.]
MRTGSIGGECFWIHRRELQGRDHLLRKNETLDIRVSLSINGMLVKVPKGTTILEAAKQLNFRIPTLCHHD